MTRLALMLIIVVGLGVAVAVAWGWTALVVYAGVLAFSTVLGMVLAILNRSGGGLLRDFGRATYERRMGNRR